MITGNINTLISDILVTIREWTNNHLVEWGVITHRADLLDIIIMLGLTVIVAIIIDYVCRGIVLLLFKKLARRTKNKWDDLIIERKIINKLMNILPPIIIYILLPLAFPDAKDPGILDFLKMICQIYLIAVSIRFINSCLRLMHEYYDEKESLKNKPLKGFFQIIQISVFFVGFILIMSILIGKSPATLFAGLGASAAILIVVFKDTILGFVAGIQLSANDMLRPGDWITMEKYGANGTVLEVTLNTVKVRNFDNTITMIPPYALVSDSFQNWRGMSDSDGRRVKRSINIDMETVKFCSDEMIEKFKQYSLLKDYIESKEKELASFNEENELLINRHRLTNIGIFRAYLLNYILQNPAVNKDLTTMVRQLQPTENGIPMELYFFTNTKDWVPYENIQSDVFDHVMAVIPEFELSIFQTISGGDIQNLTGAISAGLKIGNK